MNKIQNRPRQTQSQNTKSALNKIQNRPRQSQNTKPALNKFQNRPRHTKSALRVDPDKQQVCTQSEMITGQICTESWMNHTQPRQSLSPYWIWEDPNTKTVLNQDWSRQSWCLHQTEQTYAEPCQRQTWNLHWNRTHRDKLNFNTILENSGEN